jgi:PIN domain nuclease of toxin-antitoxin system
VIVLDASALLALLHKEAGWQLVAGETAGNDATISAVNYAEVLQKAAAHDLRAEQVDGALQALGVTVTPFGRLDARLAASFFRQGSGLSLADRVCLALARSLSSPAYTADRVWQTRADELGVEVQVIR